MSDITNELLYEVLKQIQGDIAHIKRRVDANDEQFKSIRHMLIAIQSDDLRGEAAIAGLRVDVDRIKHRLEIGDA